MLLKCLPPITISGILFSAFPLSPGYQPPKFAIQIRTPPPFWWYINHRAPFAWESGARVFHTSVCIKLLSHVPSPSEARDPLESTREKWWGGGNRDAEMSRGWEDAQEDVEKNSEENSLMGKYIVVKNCL